MTTPHRLLLAAVAACALLATTATSSMAIVGGNAASRGEYPSVASVEFGAFGCTGTLIAPDVVLTAGHCGSVTGAAGVGSPASWPAALIDVRIGGHRSGEGERVPVRSVTLHPSYTLNVGYDIALLKLTRRSTRTPTKVSGAGETALWNPGVRETIVGWGATRENGPAPSVLQEAQVPITTDAYCSGAYDDFDPRSMICAGYPEGGVDTCQGDSGGPMFGRTSTGTLRVVGATSFGEGCARPGKPGVYARVGDTALREWIRSKAPGGVA